MTQRIIPLAVVLIVGATMGWLLTKNWGEPKNPMTWTGAASPESPVKSGPPEIDQGPTPQARVATLEPQTSDNGSGGETAPLGDTLMQIQTRLDRETAQRRLLERRVQELSDKLASLGNITPGSRGQPTATVASAAGPGETPADLQARAKARTARFLAAGFDAEEERELTRRMDEVAMERLYLRDRARREGWRRTPEYREEARELRNQLRNEMGDDTYDRLLYASEQDNRVLVEKVLESSPAQEIGLQPGDVILGYDGLRVFSNRDIRTARANGEAGDPVPLRIERNGEVLELEIPRGPLGVHLDSKSVLP